jgi:hypothetical protein
MEKNNQSLIVDSFICALNNELENLNTLAISLSDPETLRFSAAKNRVAGFDWANLISDEMKYDFIAVDLPIGRGKENIKIGNSEISVRKNWAELAKVLRFLKDDGLCLALIEPPTFSFPEGRKFESALSSEGYHLVGIFNTPSGFYEKTGFRPVLAAIGKSKADHIFVAELEDEEQANKLAHAFVSKSSSAFLSEGTLIPAGSFKGFISLKAERQLSILETQYKDYKSFRLGDIATELNDLRSGEIHEEKENSIYIPVLGHSSVTCDISKVAIKHHNTIQVVLSEKANSEYLSAYFQSEIGNLVLKSLTSGTYIPRIRKSDLKDIMIALPSIDEQQEIANTYKRLSDLTVAISGFQSELALNPRSAAAIKAQLENMLEQIGGLSDADKVMSLARSGESKTIEYKETFSLDVRKGTKEKHIELSALKTIVAFLNTSGGVLLIGVSDTGATTGISEEVHKFHKNNDSFLLHFKNQIKQRIGEQYYPFINQKIVKVLGVDVLMVECDESPKPCYLDGSEFYVRTNPATDKLDGPKLVDYVQNHFSRFS